MALDRFWSGYYYRKNSEEFTTNSKKGKIIPMCSILKECLKNRFTNIRDKSPDDYSFTLFTDIKLNEDFVSKKFKKVVRNIWQDDKIQKPWTKRIPAQFIFIESLNELKNLSDNLIIFYIFLHSSANKFILLF